MCATSEIDTGKSRIIIADIKKSYILNVLETVKESKLFDKVILFGSCIGDRCTEESDIDIALFGEMTEYKMLRSKKYADFTSKIYSFDDYNQSYDLLYFKTGSKNSSSIMDDISKGEVLYER